MSLENCHQITQEEIKRMEKELNRMNCDLYEQYCEMGKCILEKAEQENKKINHLVDQIIETRQKLADAKQDKYCQKCAEVNDHSSLYCKRCGEKLPEIYSKEEDNNGRS